MLLWPSASDFDQTDPGAPIESHEVLTLRAMAWERAKGELNAMLATYWPSVGGDDSTARTEMIERVRDFVAEVEESL